MTLSGNYENGPSDSFRLRLESTQLIKSYFEKAPGDICNYFAAIIQSDANTEPSHQELGVSKGAKNFKDLRERSRLYLGLSVSDDVSVVRSRIQDIILGRA